MNTRLSEVDRFWARVRPDPTGCWLWVAHRNPKGYGRFKRSRTTHPSQRAVMAHRYSFELAYGPIPDGMSACHKCDTPACVRPDHLFLGTNANNVADKVAKGRQAKGERLPFAKLTSHDVEQIRRRLAEGGTSQRAIARDFNVCPQTITFIKQGKTWAAPRC